MYVTPMNPRRFEILEMWSRAVPQFAPTRECSVWATDDERLLGVVIMDLTDQDYNFVILARDRRGRFRTVDVGDTYFTRRMAEVALAYRMPEVHAKDDRAFERGDETGRPPDLFTPQVPHDRLYPDFMTLCYGLDFSAAREVITEMANVFEDPDGNFVRDFQTAGFSSRLCDYVKLKVLGSIELGGGRLIPCADLPDLVRRVRCRGANWTRRSEFKPPLMTLNGNGKSATFLVDYRGIA